MKLRLPHKFHAAVMAALSVVGFTHPHAQAASYYWYPSSATTYNWNTTSNYWTTSSGSTTRTTFANGAGNDVFLTTKSNSGRRTITLAMDPTVGTMTVDGAAYTLNLNNRTLTTTNLTVQNNDAKLTLNGTGTVHVSGTVTDTIAGSLVVGSSATLQVDNATSAKALMTGTALANSGTLAVNSDVTLNNGENTQAGGTLSIMDGKTLTMGGGEQQKVSIASFSKVVLDGAQITYNAAASTINGITVNNGKIGKIYVADLTNDNLVLGGTTTVNGELQLSNQWNSQFEIDKLVGAGTLSTVKGGIQWMSVTINSLSDGNQKFTGNLNLAHNNGDNRDQVLINTGTQDVSFNSLTLDYGSHAMDFTLEANAEIAQMTLTSGTANFTGNHLLTIGALTGSAPLNVEGDLTFNGTSGSANYTGALTVGGQIVKQGAGSQTITGTALHHSIDVQQGTLVLTGEYSLDGLRDGLREHYIGTDGQESTNGFFARSGNMTVYQVAGSGATLNRNAATFTFKGENVTSSVSQNGIFAVNDVDYSTLYVNQDTVDYTAHEQYARTQGGTGITSVVVKNGATVGLGENSTIVNLAYADNNSTIGLAGTGAIQSIAGTGVLDLEEGAMVTVADQALGANQTFTTSGEGKLVMQTLDVHGSNAVATIGSEAEFNQIRVGNGTVNLNGDITTERFVLSYQNAASIMNIARDATVHVTGTRLDVGSNNGSFMVSNWNQVNTINIEGNLIAEAGISVRDGKANLNVKNGGTLELHQGLLYRKNTGEYTNINVENGGTLLTAGNASDHTAAGLHVNLADGATLQGYFDSATSISIAQALTLSGSSDTAMFDVEEGKTMTIASPLGGTGGFTKKGNGTLKLSAANTYTGNTVVNEGTLLVSGAESLTSSSGVTVNGGGNLQFDASLGSSARAKAITLASGGDEQAGGMLTFTGMNDNALNVDGILTLGSGSILDVSKLNLSGAYGTVTLANTGGTIKADVSQVTVQGLAEGYTYQLLMKRDFATNTDSLVLTYSNPSEALIWRGNYDDLWVAESKATGEHTNWYALSNVWKDIPFSDNDRVRFMNDQEVRLGSDVHSGTMTVDRGRSVTVDTNGYNFSLGEIEGTDAALMVKGSANKTTEFRDVVTIKDLTLNGGTVVLDKYSNVTGQLTVQNGADMTANSYVMANTLNIDNSSVELKSAGNNIQTVSVTDSSLKVDGSSLFGDLTMNGGTLTNAGDLQLTSAEMQGTGTITGAGSISTGALNLGPGSNTTVNGGQTISITSGEGISPTVGGPLATLTLEDATITGTTAWALHTGLQVNLVSTTGTGTIFDTNDHIITVDSVLGGNGNLTKDGLGTLVLRGADYDYTGNTTVAGGTLRLDNTNALVNAASVSVEGDSSLWLNTGSNVLTLGTASIANGATLRLAGENLLNIADGKSLTLNNGAIIDVSSVQFTPGVEKDYVLATGSVSCTDLSSIQLIFEHGEYPAPGSTTQLLYENGQLLLHYTLNKPKDLIWDGGEAAWDVGSTAHWHSAETPSVSTTFNTYDDVTFEYQEGLDSKANVTTVDIHATDMYIEAGTVDDENIVELNVGSGRKLDVDFIVTGDNTQIKKTGSGTAYLGVDDETFSSDMIVSGGTLTAQFVDMADNGVNLKVTGDLTRSNGELNVIVGDGYHDTYATFEQGTTVQGVTNIETKEMANVEFNGVVSIIGSNPTITAGDGTTISFKGATSVDSNSMTFAGKGNVYMGENTTFSQGGGRHTYLKDAVNVTIEKMSTSQDQTFLLYDGTSLTIKDVYLEKTDGEQVMYTGYQAKADDTERQFITIDTIHFNNSPNARLAAGAISTATAGEDEQQTGDIYVNTLISGTTESGEIVPSTFVFANYAKPRNDYAPTGVGGRDYDVPEVLHLGGDNDSQFAGTILVCDHNVNSAQGIGYGGTENARKDTLVILNDNTVAANAVFDFDVIGQYSDYGLGINSDHVKILGIKGTELPGDDTFLIFSGNIGTALRAEYGSDNEVRTLELAGDDTYVSSGTVDKNLNLVKSGTGNQTFTGATDRFDANIDIQDGVLAFTKANAALTVEDLTLGAHGSKTDTTLSVRNANGTVGTVELKGTLTAHGEGRNTGAALDANLTLGQDAVLNVRETVTGTPNPSPELPGRYDYLGGMDMLGNSITLTGQSVLSDSDLQTLLGMQWGDRYELAFNLSSLTVGGVTYTEPIEFDREHLENNIDASRYFSNLKESNYCICYSGVGLEGPGGNVGVFYIFKAPEPTTSTLSLLALCALTARRRRKN